MVRLKVASEDVVRLGVNESLASSYDDTELRERIGDLEEDKVDKVAGKGLSTNDYTDADKAEVAKVVTKADKTELTKTDRRLDALYELTQGQAWDFETVENDTNPVIVPNGAKMCNLQKISGNSVVWNQLIDEHAFVSGTSKGITLTNNNDGTLTLNGTATENYNVYITINNTYSSHKYYFGGCPVGGSLNSYYLGAYGAAVDMGNGGIYQHPSTFDFINFRIDVRSGATVNNLVFKPRLVDLTHHFGSGNEPTDVNDPRIEWVKDYAERHPEYKAGEIISFGADSIDIRDGKNLYTVISHTLPIATYFPDGMNGFGSVEDDITKDKAVKRICKVDLGSLNWLQSTTYNSVFYANVSDMALGVAQSKANILCPLYLTETTVSGASYMAQKPDASISVLNESYSRILIRDTSCVDVSALVSKLSNVSAYYELATPIETTVTDWIEPFEVEAGGTITFVDGEENSIPTNTTEEYTVKLSEVVTNG